MACGCKKNNQTEPVQQVPLTITVSESQSSSQPAQPEPTQSTNNPS